MAGLLRQGLEEQNHRVLITSTGPAALAALEELDIDAAILDVMMPGCSGIEVTRRIRPLKPHLPVLMLTARDAPEDIVAALDAGADDYLTKPFAFAVLTARLRALARRAGTPQVVKLAVGDVVLDPAARLATRGGVALPLTATEFRLLEFLMRRSGRAASRSAIIEAVWGMGAEVEQNTVDAFIKLLRAKVETPGAGRMIHTVRGFGYILREPS